MTEMQRTGKYTSWRIAIGADGLALFPEAIRTEPRAKARIPPLNGKGNIMFETHLVNDAFALFNVALGECTGVVPTEGRICGVLGLGRVAAAGQRRHRARAVWGSPYGRAYYYRPPPPYSSTGLGPADFDDDDDDDRDRRGAPRQLRRATPGDRTDLAADDPLPQQLSGRQHRHRHQGAPAVPRQVGDRGAALSDLGRPRGLHLDRHGDDQPQGGVAGLASARGDARARLRACRRR